jgi:AraC family transcriptional regulator
MGREVNVGRREALLIVSQRRPVRLSEIGAALGAAFGEVYGYLASRRVEPDGPPFVIYHGAPTGDDPFDVEICAPIARTTDPPAGWQVQLLPAGTFATLLHVGPYDTVAMAYDVLMARISAMGLGVAGPPREVYVSEPGTPPELVKTIIEIPVSAVTEPIAAGSRQP